MMYATCNKLAGGLLINIETGFISLFGSDEIYLKE